MGGWALGLDLRHAIRVMRAQPGVAAVGLLLGLGAAAASTRLMQSILFGVEPLDPITFATMPAVSRGSARRHSPRSV